MTTWSPGLNLCHARADRAHDASAFVAEHFGKFGRVISVAAMQIGRTHAAGDDFDQQFVRARITQIDLLDR